MTLLARASGGLATRPAHCPRGPALRRRRSAEFETGHDDLAVAGLARDCDEPAKPSTDSLVDVERAQQLCGVGGAELSSLQRVKEAKAKVLKSEKTKRARIARKIAAAAAGVPPVPGGAASAKVPAIETVLPLPNCTAGQSGTHTGSP